MSILTDQAYNAEAIPNLSNSQPTEVYYSPTDPLGTVNLWPVPNTNTNQLELFYGVLPATFADLVTSYTAPPAYAKAFRLQLAKALIPFYTVPETRSQQVLSQAEEAIDDVKTRNVRSRLPHSSPTATGVSRHCCGTSSTQSASLPDASSGTTFRRL